MATTTKGSFTNKVSMLIAGINKNFTAKNSVTVDGQSMTQAQLLAQLGTLVTLAGNVTDTKAPWTAAVAAWKAALPGGEEFVSELITALKSTLGKNSPLLASFGIATPKPKAARTAVAKAVSSALSKNTRVVRGTKGPKARLEVTTAGKPGLVVVSPSGEPLLTVGPVAPGSSEPATVTVGATAGAAAAAGSTPEAGSATGTTAGATAPTTGSTSGA